MWVIREVYWDKMVGWGVGGRLESVYGLEGVKMGYKRIDEESGKGVMDECERGREYWSENYVCMVKSDG